ERFFGLENFGNTCYCNSCVVYLHYCTPLTYYVYGLSLSYGENSVLSQLAELFSSISKQKRRSGHLAPREFLRTLQERNELFRGNKQQVQYD
ncbi:unnamed protein product, partial [Ascophyllum nodosum]